MRDKGGGGGPCGLGKGQAAEGAEGGASAEGERGTIGGRVVQRLEDWVGQGRKVKEDVKEEVEEVDEGKEGKVKEEVEAQVVAEKGEVSGMVWLRSFLGGQEAAVIMDMPWHHAVLAEPRPRPSTTPFSCPRRVQL